MRLKRIITKYGDIKVLQETTGYSPLTIRRALSGEVNTDASKEIRKCAREMGCPYISDKY